MVRLIYTIEHNLKFYKGTNDREEAANDEDESDAEEVTEKVSKKRRVSSATHKLFIFNSSLGTAYWIDVGLRFQLYQSKRIRIGACG